MADEKRGRTLFVRNLPYTSTNESLENVFSDIGPVKSCFVVKDKETGKCRGFGYVKFTLLEDAEKALSTVKKVEGRHVHIVYANKKEKKKRFGQPQNPATTEVTTTVSVQKGAHEAVKEKKKQKKGSTPVKGQKQAPNPLNEGKRARLIVRNLAFRCTKEELKQAFEKYGTVVDVHIPKKDSGTRLGFGFVQFSNRTQAGMAVKDINGKEICGRVVAVDWALPKDKFESKLAAKTSVTEEVDEKKESLQDEEMEVDKEDEGDEMIASVPNSVSSRGNECSSSEDEEGKESSIEEEEDPEEDDGSSSEESYNDGGRRSSDKNDEDDSGFENETLGSSRQQHSDQESDVNEGRTVFIRNLPYAIENEEVEEFFSQFGDVKYARVVVDRNTGMPKGSAFVQFQSKEAAESCVKAATKEEGFAFSLGGRNLLVSLAVNRQQAGDFVQKKDKKKEQKDSRNLFLAREGMIRPGTSLAKDVPAADLTKRMKIDAAKRRKLKDQNIFVSSTRLCVHNIPPTVTDQKLRGIVLKAAGAKDAKLVECRIMRDLNRLNSQGVGKSRGYAFCAFTEHEHALGALRNLNNNPDIFGDKKRLIVEFSLENINALKAKQKRLEKSKVKLKQKSDEPQSASTFTNATDNRWKKKKRKAQKKWEKNPLDSKKEQDKVARSLHKGPIGLPSHSGPKQRHKARPSQQTVGGKVKRIHDGTVAPNKKSPKEKPIKIKSSKRKDTDSFDKLVAAYKQKIMKSAVF